MSAPYKAWIYGPWGDRTYEFETFEEALQFATDLRDRGRGRLTTYRVIGDGYDCDSDEHGYFECYDGLTDAERERVEEVGLI